MVDKHVQVLIERVIDSPLKLQLLLLFCEHRKLEGTAAEIALRTYRDEWSTGEALAELADDGVLAVQGSSEPAYRYNPRQDLVEPIVRLCSLYNEPLERDLLQRSVRDAATFAPYRRASAESGQRFYAVGM